MYVKYRSMIVADKGIIWVTILCTKLYEGNWLDMKSVLYTVFYSVINEKH